MRRRDWYLGVLIVAGALVLHLIFPRYEYRSLNGSIVTIQVDRWTGRTYVVRPSRAPKPTPDETTEPRPQATGLPPIGAPMPDTLTPPQPPNGK